MARTGERGPSFADRVARAGLTPQQAENARATLLLAELVDELCGLIHAQTGELAEQNDRLAEQNDLLDDIRNGRRGERAPSGPDKGKGGDGAVQLREPATPPPDPDEGPDDTANRGGAVAEPATSKPAARRTAAKAAAGKTAAKATAAARRSAGKSTGKG